MRLTRSAKLRAYHLYRHLVPPPLFRLRDVNILVDAYSPATAAYFTSLLMSPEPVFICRIGGNDEEKAYINNPGSFTRPETCLRHMRRVQELRGYFDFEDNPANFIKFLDVHIEAFRNADCLFYGSFSLISMFEHNVVLPSDMKLLNHVCTGKTLINYNFVEAIRPFLGTFSIWGEGKRILIVSPFSRTIEYQYVRRNELIEGYEYPEFDLLTYTSPVTWSTAQDTRETLKVSTGNWHEQYRLMCSEVAALDFDVALLSCGCYAVPLGDFICHTMGRKAVYLGGVLNVLFNIYGPRYDTPYFNSIMRAETQVEAFENDEVLSLQGGRAYENEAMRAYFGRRTPD